MRKTSCWRTLLHASRVQEQSKQCWFARLKHTSSGSVRNNHTLAIMFLLMSWATLWTRLFIATCCAASRDEVVATPQKILGGPQIGSKCHCRAVRGLCGHRWSLSTRMAAKSGRRQTVRCAVVSAFVHADGESLLTCQQRANCGYAVHVGAYTYALLVCRRIKCAVDLQPPFSLPRVAKDSGPFCGNTWRSGSSHGLDGKWVTPRRGR